MSSPMLLASYAAPAYPFTIPESTVETVSMPESKMTQDLPTHISTEVAYYLACALWTDVEEEHPEARVGNFSVESVAFANDLMAKFRSMVDAEFTTEELTYILGACDRHPGEFGMCLWLSTNGHGTGFWDKDEIWTKSFGDRLHGLAKKIEFHGMVYFDPETSTAEICV